MGLRRPIEVQVALQRVSVVEGIIKPQRVDPTVIEIDERRAGLVVEAAADGQLLLEVGVAAVILPRRSCLPLNARMTLCAQC